MSSKAQEPTIVQIHHAKKSYTRTLNLLIALGLSAGSDISDLPNAKYKNTHTCASVFQSELLK